jgi:replication factor A1
MMAAAAQLTPGAVAAIAEHADGMGTLQPVLQVVDVRMVKNVDNPSAECFRMVLSDGVYTLRSMVDTAHNPRVRDGSIRKGSIIRLLEFTCSTIQSRR